MSKRPSSGSKKSHAYQPCKVGMITIPRVVKGLPGSGKFTFNNYQTNATCEQSLIRYTVTT